MTLMLVPRWLLILSETSYSAAAASPWSKCNSRMETDAYVDANPLARLASAITVNRIHGVLQYTAGGDFRSSRRPFREGRSSQLHHSTKINRNYGEHDNGGCGLLRASTCIHLPLSDNSRGCWSYNKPLAAVACGHLLEQQRGMRGRFQRK
jgi:hypothetical protein